MKDKRGFTLVELLAVIAILAILMLLIMPNILSMFTEGRKDAFKVQIGSIVRAAQEKKQSDFMENANTYVYCDGVDDSCNKLSITESDIKYMVVFDGYNKVVGVALQNSNYCYVKGGDISNINTEDFIQNSTLSCTGTTGTCSGGSSVSLPSGERYVYWGLNEGGKNVQYASNQKPDTTYDSYTSFGFDNAGLFIRTKINASNEASGHEACMFFNNKIYCFKQGYWVSGDSDGSSTMVKLKADMESSYGQSTSSCGKDPTYAVCRMGSNASAAPRCIAKPTNQSYCQMGDNNCGVYGSGKAYCN